MATSDISTAFNANSDKELINPSELSDELIVNKINGIRSNNQLSESDLISIKIYGNTTIPIKESFCHAFYRMLGLPVINKYLTNFYNPGFYGNEQGVNAVERDNINSNQDDDLKRFENWREMVCNQNTLSFDKVDPKFQYRLDMLQQRMSLDNFTPGTSAFKGDWQEHPLTKRVLYTPARKMLRPFKCCAQLCNNVYPITNSVCAPFVSENNSVVNSTTLIKPYLEFVIRTRLTKDIPSNSTSNEFYKTLQSQIQNFNLPENMQQTINPFAELENYISTQMFQSLFYVCKNIGVECKKSIKIVDQINEKIKLQKTAAVNANTNTENTSLTFDVVDDAIQKLQSQIASKELLLSALPNYTIKGADGSNISLQNYINCPLIAPFIKMVQPNISDLRKQVDYLNAEKQKRLKLFNSLNKSIFYTIGEVYGVGLIDIIAIMLAFWIIPKDYLLSMLDTASFIRLYREPNLQNENVIERHTKYNDQPKVNIEEVITNFDQTIVQLLKSCEEIIKKNSV